MATTLNGATPRVEAPETSLGDLAGLVLRLRGQLRVTSYEAGWRRQRLRDGAEIMREWTERLEPPYSKEPPTGKEVATRLRWWRRVWKEYQAHHEVEVLLAEALPWLEGQRGALELRAEIEA
jgi:hypothetical protein